MTLAEFKELTRSTSLTTEVRVISVSEANEIGTLEDAENCELICTLKSSLKSRCYLLPELCQAEVKEVFALSADVFLAVIDDTYLP